MRRIFTWALWILLIVALGAVIYFVWTQVITDDEEELVGSSVKLVCSSACRDRGQCGRTLESPQLEVVLGGLDGPAVEANTHDRFIPAGATVEIRETRTERLEQINGRQFDENFSRVEWRNNIGDIQKTGWFADWCIEQP
jgi:hypothetical protein